VANPPPKNTISNWKRQKDKLLSQLAQTAGQWRELLTQGESSHAGRHGWCRYCAHPLLEPPAAISRPPRHARPPTGVGVVGRWAPGTGGTLRVRFAWHHGWRPRRRGRPLGLLARWCCAGPGHRVGGGASFVPLRRLRCGPGQEGQRHNQWLCSQRAVRHC
jgi:hypothetical protein